MINVIPFALPKLDADRKAMPTGDRNTITLDAAGPRGGSAVVLVSDH